MSQGRKSSISDVRRGALKAHVPYRADDLTQGKKTGISVKYVHRNSDGFESFGEVLDQADGVTPPHVRAKRKGRREPSPEEDRDGEVSMEIDNCAYWTINVSAMLLLLMKSWRNSYCGQSSTLS